MSMVNLHNSCNEGVDASDDLLLSTAFEPMAYDFYETTVEPYVQLLDSPPLFSNKVSSADQATMTLHSKTFSIKYIDRKSITLYEKTCLSVCRRRQCPIERGGADSLEVRLEEARAEHACLQTSNADFEQR